MYSTPVLYQKERAIEVRLNPSYQLFIILQVVTLEFNKASNPFQRTMWCLPCEEMAVEKK